MKVKPQVTLPWGTMAPSEQALFGVWGEEVEFVILLLSQSRCIEQQTLGMSLPMALQGAKMLHLQWLAWEVRFLKEGKEDP